MRKYFYSNTVAYEQNKLREVVNEEINSRLYIGKERQRDGPPYKCKTLSYAQIGNHILAHKHTDVVNLISFLDKIFISTMSKSCLLLKQLVGNLECVLSEKTSK